MTKLASESCEACRIDAPKLSDAEINDLLNDLDAWDLITEPVKQLKKEFNFPDYQSSLAFVNTIAAMADQEEVRQQDFLGGSHDPDGQLRH